MCYPRGGSCRVSGAGGAVPAELTDEEAASALGGRQERVLVVRPPQGTHAFRGFARAEHAARFNSRVQGLTHEWCCHKGGVVKHPFTPFAGAAPSIEY